ncbi:MAG: hypothetical protein IKC05_05195, partial [Lentisphaeria bacterium]|nr:hypothetical protein [Lentisphaeria bacterium]
MSNRFINLFVQDYPRKLLALLFAVILYVGVSSNIFRERQITGVPVDKGKVELPRFLGLLLFYVKNAEGHDGVDDHGF